MNFESSQSLAVRFKSGDESALSEMYSRYANSMFVTALSIVGHRDLAAEAVQQAFVQAWQAAARFDVSRELQPWLYAITRRAAIDAYRRAQRFSATSLDVIGDAGIVIDPPSLDQAWESWEVRRAMRQLTGDEREVIRLAHFVGMSHAEISRHLQIPLGTVKSRTARAQRRLAEMLMHLLSESESPSGPLRKRCAKASSCSQMAGIFRCERK
ncbi:RNA polymerase sigma factor [Streptomyces sp. NPDC093595]|uniref:RNA polymerase sigma factor n=1 Tax=Streptomyces sp. NPDC093595 TaxID=3366045 RepID=UPI00380FD395